MLAKKEAEDMRRPQQDKEPPPLPGAPENFSSTVGHIQDDQWEVSAILGKRVGKYRRFEYLIEFDGWSDEHNQWLAASEVDSALVEAFDEEHPEPTHRAWEPAPPAPNQRAAAPPAVCVECACCMVAGKRGQLGAAAEKKMRRVRARMFAALDSMPGVIKFVVNDFDEHRWRDLLSELHVPPGLVFKAPRRRGVAVERATQDNLHELSSYLRFEEFDAAHAHGASKVTSAAGALATVHKINVTWRSGTVDALTVHFSVSTVEGAGHVTPAPTLEQAAATDALAAQTVARAQLLCRREPARLRSAGVAAAKTIAFGDLVADCEAVYEADERDAAETLNLSSHHVRGLLEHPMERILKEVLQERRAAEAPRRAAAAAAQAQRRAAEEAEVRAMKAAAAKAAAEAHARAVAARAIAAALAPADGPPPPRAHTSSPPPGARYVAPPRWIADHRDAQRRRPSHVEQTVCERLAVKAGMHAARAVRDTHTLCKGRGMGGARRGRAMVMMAKLRVANDGGE